MNRNALITATLAGLVLQLAMVIAGHFIEPIRDKGFAIGGMGFSLVAGAVYGWRAKQAWAPSAGGGAIAGGVCALLGIAVSTALGDVPPFILLVGTATSTMSGAIGGALGRLL